MRRLLAAAAVVLTLAGCSSIDSGFITEKIHEPAHTTYITQCNVVGKTTICTPVPYFDDEDWRFDLENGDDTGYVYVTQETYDAYEVGDNFVPVKQ